MDWSELIRTVGLPVAMLLASLWAGSRGLWVFGVTHRWIVDRLQADFDDMKEDRDFWRNAALRGSDLAEVAVTSAEKAVTAAIAPPGRRRRAP